MVFDDEDKLEKAATATVVELLWPTSEPANDSHVPLDLERTPEQRRSSTAYLDGLRGVAAFIVFIQHYFASFAIMGVHNQGFLQDGHWDNTRLCNWPIVRLLFSGGHAAVTVFFVLSGYVLSVGPLSHIAHGKAPRAVRKGLAGAVVRRPFRLYLPPIAVTFLVAVAMHVPNLVQQGIENGPKATLGAELTSWVSSTASFLTPWTYHDNDGRLFLYNIVVWTLPIELNGSLWVYAVVLLASCFLAADTRGRAALLAGTLGVLAVALLQTGHKWSGAAFSMGIILALVDMFSLDSYAALARLSPLTRALTTHSALILGVYLLSQPTSSFAGSAATPGWTTLSSLTPNAYSKGHGGTQHQALYVRYWGTYGALLVVYATLRIHWLQRFFARPSLRYLGKVSFMLYLIHVPWTHILLDRWHAALGGLDMLFGAREPRVFWYEDILWIPDLGPLGLNTRWLASLVVAVPTTLVLAQLATRTIDAWSVRFAEKVAASVGLGRVEKTPGEEVGGEKPLLQLLPRWRSSSEPRERPPRISSLQHTWSPP